MRGPVLVVDDDCDLCALIKQMLESHDCSVATAHNLSSLLEHAGDLSRYRIIFIDIDLGPDQPSGIEVYKWLLSCHFSGKIYFLTGHGKSHPCVLKALEIGAVEVLSKPIAPMNFVRLAREERV